MNEWSYTATYPLCRHNVDRDNFTFFYEQTIHI